MTRYFVRRATGNRGYEIDESIEPTTLLSIVWLRATSLIRAQFALLGCRTPRLCFVEPSVSIIGRRKLESGPGLVLERYAILNCNSRNGIRLGSRVTIGKFSLVEGTGVLWAQAVGLSVGDRSSIGDYCFIGTGGGVSIGNDVLMGQRVAIHSENHRYKDSEQTINVQGVRRQGVVIGNDVWLGSGSVILDGVNVGDGAVVASGAIVNRDVVAYSVVAGSPASVVAWREPRAKEPKS